MNVLLNFIVRDMIVNGAFRLTAVFFFLQKQPTEYQGGFPYKSNTVGNILHDRLGLNFENIQKQNNLHY